LAQGEISISRNPSAMFSFVLFSLVAGKTLSFAVSDCGASATHGHVTSLTPSSGSTGTLLHLTGAGTVDEAVQEGAQYDLTISLPPLPGVKKTASFCGTNTVDMPLGLGNMTTNVACPLAAGPISVGIDVYISNSMISGTAKLHLTGKDQSGADLLCMDTTVTIASEEDDMLMI